jgi:hypothetical protein
MVKKLAKRCPTVEGFLAGQCVAYCEQVRLGSRLAGAINCERAYTEQLKRIVTQEGCRWKTVATGSGRVCLWVYRYPFLNGIIDQLEAVTEQQSGGVFGLWAMGKLFGYADHEIAAYVEEHATRGVR